MQVTTVGIDIAKNVFQLHGADKYGKKVFSQRVSRNNLSSVVHQLTPCVIGMESCGTAHYWARKFSQMGHTVKLMSPQFVKPYVKSNKTDRNDAEGICEAVVRPSMRFVSIKSVCQQDIQLIHKIRSKIMKDKVAIRLEDYCWNMELP